MKIQLGKTPEQIEREEAERLRQLEAEAQQRDIEHQKKIQALRKVQIRNKIIIISSFIILFIAMMIFGIYNIFIKKSMTPEEVENMVGQSQGYTQQVMYFTDGINGYIANNIDGMFNKYSIINDQDIQSIDIDKNSVEILRCSNLYSATYQVDFSVDITVKHKDILITDPTIIDILQRNGLQIPNEEPTTEEVTTTEAPIVVASETDAEEVVQEATSEEPTTEITTTEEITTEELINEEEGVAYIPNNVSKVDSDGSVKNYYLKGNSIYQVGDSETKTYVFTVPIEYYSDEKTKGTGFRLVGEMSLFGFERIDQTNFEKINVSDYYKFNSEAKVDAQTLDSAKIKVDKTLEDLYSGRDVSQDFENKYVFETYDAKYVSLDKLEMYSQENAGGYNALVTYRIELYGFTYTVNAYLHIRQDGNSWVIDKYR